MQPIDMMSALVTGGTGGFIAAVSEPYVTNQFHSGMFLPPLIAMVVATPTWVGATGLILYAGMLVRSRHNVADEASGGSTS